MHWILWQTVAASAIITYITILEHFRRISFIHGYVAFCISVAALGWVVPIAYSKAPTFTQAYIIQNGLLPILGFLVAVLFFKESPSWLSYVGAASITAGVILMAK